MEMVTVNLVREGVNKHKARELAEHFYGLSQPAVQEPVGRVCFEGDEVVWIDEPPESGTLLYTATPPAQPAVPDAIHHTDLSEHPQYIEGWNDCRAEMLKGMK
jgi:hypothetical protein